MKHDAFERNNPVGIKPKNPFVVRCDVILLNRAIRKAEKFALMQIGNANTFYDIDAGKEITLDDINTGIGYIRDAKCKVKIALQDGEISDKTLFVIADKLCQAYKYVPIEPVLAAWECTLDFVADMPIPYRVIEADDESVSPIGTIVPKKCKCGNDLKVAEELVRGFCVHCAYGWNDEPIVTWSDATLAHYNAQYNNTTHVTFKLECVGFNRYNPKFDSGHAVDLLIGAAIEMSAIKVGDESRGCLKALRDYLSEHRVSFAVNWAAIKHLGNFYAPGAVRQIYWNGGAK